MTEQIAADTQSAGPLDQLADYLSNAIDKTDEAAAIERVLELRKSYPNAGTTELVTRLIRQKCILTGGMGALTSTVSLVGIPINIGLTFKWQAELVLEIAAVNERALSKEEKRAIVLIVTGSSASSNQIAKWLSRRLERKAAQQMSNNTVGRVTIVPFIGAITLASANVLITYLIGRRAHAYFQIPPGALNTRAEQVEAITGISLG